MFRAPISHVQGIRQGIRQGCMPRLSSSALNAASRDRPVLQISRSASTKASSKPPVLEKPAKFNPPSHPARLKKHTPRSYPGPPLSSAEQTAQRVKQYPNMMPPEGSFMHWFLTNRSIHIWITLGTLTSLAVFTFATNFRETSHFAHLLPPTSSLFQHPISFVSTYIEVLKLHTAHTSAETAHKRKQSVADVEKRSRYRKAHGVSEEGIGGWTARENKDLLGPAIITEPDPASPVNIDHLPDAPDGGHPDRDEKRRPVKKWFGIWG